jgi:ABC-type glycerol-3-phosphate transport system substrate-binding protein
VLFILLQVRVLGGKIVSGQSSRLWRSTLLAGAVSMLVAACSVPASTPVIQVVTATPGAAAPQEKFDLRVGFDCGTYDTPAYNVMLAGFAALHPNVNVVKERIAGDYSHQILTMAAAGTLPNVFEGADLYTVPLSIFLPVPRS